MKKIAIIGASYLQEPLISLAKNMGIETHVFAWAAGDVGEKIADRFYPISIVEKEEILSVCQKIGVDGICSIASDLAMVTVNYVAEKMGLAGNSFNATLKSTNKHLMREAFKAAGDPSPESVEVDTDTDLSALGFTYPVIVKPTDRSGSRGICKVYDKSLLEKAVKVAIEQSFEKKALIEEFCEGKEYSVEFISQNGEHQFLAITEKFTTGAPHFIETGHIEPPDLNPETEKKVIKIVEHALTTLSIKNGASHTEVKIDKNGVIKIIETGGRMGGDFIGSDLVKLHTGFDFVRAVIDIALGINYKEDKECFTDDKSAAAVRFIFGENDIKVYEKLLREHKEYIVSKEIGTPDKEVTDSASRFGYYLFKAEKREDLLSYLPESENNE
ncbi:MAG: ATP-grasp domain-containing protein [Clostridia bacterium]|nr:ATP-grasp domain-containing protein [Clostridia bacterium]